MRVDESNHETLQRAYDITGSINKIYWRDAENIDGYIDTDDVMTLMEELINEYEHKADEVRDLENKEENDRDCYIDQLIDAKREEEIFGE